MKKKIIFRVCIILCVVCTIFFVADRNKKLSYSQCVGEFERTEFVNKWLEKGEVYAVGVNSRGNAIFKDRKAAYEQAKNDYKKAFDYLYEYKHLPELSSKASVCTRYYTEAMQANVPMTVHDYEEIQKQCNEAAGFLEIYLNSFEPIYYYEDGRRMWVW